MVYRRMLLYSIYKRVHVHAHIQFYILGVLSIAKCSDKILKVTFRFMAIYMTALE